MLSIIDPNDRNTSGINRRDWLRIGGLNALGLSLGSPLLAEGESSITVEQAATFGRAKNVIYLYLGGGPPQHETFDPKPDAPVDLRGPFKPIQTNIPGTQFCELLPRTSRIADKLAVMRGLSTDDNTHSTSAYWMLTGFKYQGPNARELHPSDWPNLGSVVKLLKPSDTVPFSFAWLPEPMVANPGVLVSGQSAGFLGSQADPDRFTCNPHSPDFAIKEFSLPGDISPLRLNKRAGLLSQLNDHFATVESKANVENFSRLRQEAYSVLTTGRAREAFDLDKEPEALRDRYGRGKWGQSVLLARRLIESGVRFVHVQWPREPGDLSSNRPMWDTHADNNNRVKDVLCPQFDVSFTALIEDLEDRGLLDETLVVAVGEFGRTPNFNAAGGRDHWGPVFSGALAGAGISGGQVYGESDKNGAYPISGKILPQELCATIFHLLGISHEATMLDRFNRPLRICDGEPLYHLLGSKPATDARQEATGVVPEIPDFRPIYEMKTG